MRNRWFHAPVLHSAYKGDKKVSWLELFYDLIFVAAVIRLGDALHAGLPSRGLEMFLQVAIHFVPLWVAWTGFTFFSNRFSVDDFLHRALVFVNMFAVGAMAMAAPQALAPEPRPSKFALAHAVMLGCVALMYFRAYRQQLEGRAFSRFWGLVFGGAALLWAVSAAVVKPYCYGLWGIATLSLLYAPISRQSRGLLELHPIDMSHLSERYGLLTIIVLGESFVNVLSTLASGELLASPELLIKGCLNLLITCCIWWIYFDDVAGAKLKQGRVSFVVWLYGHIPLTIAITAIGVSMKKAIAFDLMKVAPAGPRWLFATSVSVALLAVAVIDSATLRRNAELSDQTRVNVRLGSALVVLLLGQIGASMNAGVFVALVAAMCLAQVLFDMMMAPFEEDRGELEALSFAELSRRRADGQVGSDEVAARQRNFGNAVRKGTPGDMRRDLYFFFIEGSWTRMLMSLAFTYVLLNVVFAGLYLMQPGSFSTKPATFLDAFSFSVQTMSTIGYGALSPQTAYGDFIVVLEAATGILVTAFATGLMFAKASRPRSSVLFSQPLVVTTMHGKPTLMFRAGNARGNEVVDASLSFSVLCDHVTPEGHHTRRIRDLKLVRARTPIFTLSWTVMHELDEDSPLFGVDWDNPHERVLMFIATIMGHDSTYGQTTHARHTYFPDDVRNRSNFVDVISQLEDGRLLIDYSLFHQVKPEAPASSSPISSSPADDAPASGAPKAHRSEAAASKPPSATPPAAD